MPGNGGELVELLKCVILAARMGYVFFRLVRVIRLFPVD
jgi:hypothetical protein